MVKELSDQYISMENTAECQMKEISC